MTDDILISEPDVLKRWPALSKAGLLAARKTGTIAWVRGKRGSAWYRPSAIETFITKELEQPCLDRGLAPSSRSATNGLPTSKDPKNYTASGLSQELEELVAQVSVQKIFEKQ